MGLGRLVPEVNGMNYLYFLAPGIMVAAAMNSASYECTFGSYTRMITQKSYEAILMTPISLEEIVIGDILYGALKGLFSAAALAVLLVLMGVIELTPALLSIPLLFLTGFLFASLSMIVTALSPSYEFFSYYFTLFITPMFLLSGVFFPIDSLPPWIQTVSLCFPLTHSVHIARSLIYEVTLAPHLGSLLWLLVITSFSLVMAIRWCHRRLIR
jgi:lipooligosaccharide transport system permease protein